MAGWGSFVGMLADWIPGRREAIQNKISALEKEQYALQNKDKAAWSAADVIRYAALAEQLRELRKKEYRIK